ncbi:hypothetical protein D3C76_1642400 [compost metagenome]
MRIILAQVRAEPWRRQADFAFPVFILQIASMHAGVEGFPPPFIHAQQGSYIHIPEPGLTSPLRRFQPVAVHPLGAFNMNLAVRILVVDLLV